LVTHRGVLLLDLRQSITLAIVHLARQPVFQGPQRKRPCQRRFLAQPPTSFHTHGLAKVSSQANCGWRCAPKLVKTLALREIAQGVWSTTLSLKEMQAV
jgi:hypothetical protein